MDNDTATYLGRTVVYNDGGTLKAALVVGINVAATADVALRVFDPAGGASTFVASAVVHRADAGPAVGTWSPLPSPAVRLNLQS